MSKKTEKRIFIGWAILCGILMLFILFVGYPAEAATPNNSSSVKLLNQKITNSTEWQSEIRHVYHLNENHCWKAVNRDRDENGTLRMRFQQFYQSIEIDGAILIVSQVETGFRITGTVYNILNKETSNLVATGKVEQALANKSATFSKLPFEVGNLNGQSKTVWILDSSNEDFVIAYKIEATVKNDLHSYSVYANATTGNLISYNANSCYVDAIGTAHTAYHGTQQIATSANQNSFTLKATSKGNGVETINLNGNLSYTNITDFTDADNIWEQNKPAFEKYSSDAHFCALEYYDFLNEKFNRNSLDGNGYKLVSYLNYSTNLVNAFWNGSAVVYGSGNSGQSPLTTLDIAGHEFTHGLLQKTSGLNYSGQPGIINESLSDIFGTALEYHSDQQNFNWTIGEKSGMTLRSMSDPSLYNQPDTYLGTHWYAGTGDNGGVHINSGFINKWFNLIADGGSGTNDNGLNYSITGMGFTDALRIVYHAMIGYLVPQTNFEDFKKATLWSAADLFGNCSPQVNKVASAWKAVGLGDGFAETPVLVATGNTVFCEGEAVTLAVSGWPGSTFSLVQNNTMIQTGTSPNFDISTSGIWKVIENRCGAYIESNTINTVVYQLPIVSTSNVTVCEGMEAHLTGFPSGGSFNIANPYTGSSQGFSYTFTDSNGCTSSASATVTVNSVTEAVINLSNHSSYPLNNEAIFLTGNVPAQFSGLGVSNSYFNPSQAGLGGSYAIKMIHTNAQGCVSEDVVQVMVVDPCVKDVSTMGIIAESNIANPKGISFFSVDADDSDFQIVWILPANCQAVTALNENRIGILSPSQNMRLTAQITNTCGDVFEKQYYLKVSPINPEPVLTLFPVPVSNVLHISLKGNQSVGTVQVSNSNGKLVLLKSFNTETLTLETGNLSEGIYTLEIVAGNIIHTKKFVKIN